MKDYSYCIFNRNSYILNYRIVDKEYNFSSGNVDVKGKRIIVTYADKSEKEFDYSNEMEESIIKQMEDQALYAEPIEVSRALCIFSGAEIPFIAYNLIYYINSGNSKYIIPLSFLGISEAIFGSILINRHLTQKDIDKMHYYLDNKDILNYKFQNADLNSLKLSRKATNEINNKKSSNDFKIDLNNIEEFSLKDLIKIRETIVNEDYEYGDDEEFVDTFDDNEGYVLRRGPHSMKSYYKNKR